jgi:hypothetical protein
MGIVYKARQLSLNRPVAVKMIFQALVLGDRGPRLLAEVVADEGIFDRVLTLAVADSPAVAGKLLATRAERFARRSHSDRAAADYQWAAKLSPLARKAPKSPAKR